MRPETLENILGALNYIRRQNTSDLNKLAIDDTASKFTGAKSSVTISFDLNSNFSFYPSQKAPDFILPK